MSLGCIEICCVLNHRKLHEMWKDECFIHRKLQKPDVQSIVTPQDDIIMLPEKVGKKEHNDISFL